MARWLSRSSKVVGSDTGSASVDSPLTPSRFTPVTTHFYCIVTPAQRRLQQRSWEAIRRDMQPCTLKTDKATRRAS